MRKQNFFQKGFTLIELLVVIAIIGILAAVVIASLSSARDRGKVAKVQSQMSSARAQAELFRSNHSNKYNGLCSSNLTSYPDNIYTSMLDAAVLMNPAITALGNSVSTGQSTTGNNSAMCHVTAAGDEYALSLPIKVSASGTASLWWCIDSNGAGIQVATRLTANQTSCPTS